MTNGVSELLAVVSEVFVSATGWVGEVATIITEQPILIVACVGIPMCTLGINMFKRLLSARA